MITSTPQSEPSFAPATKPGAGNHEVLGDGTRVVIRPIHQSDIELERSSTCAMSPASRSFRFLDTMRWPTEALLKLMTTIDNATDAAYVATVQVAGKEHEIGVA